MAGSAVTTDISELEKGRLGYIAISLNEWTTTNEPTITAGSKIEIDGALYEFTADEDMDVAGAWGGFGASSLVYCYINPATVVPYMSATAPAWDDAKQGYYLAASPTHRCYTKLWKDGAGGYALKEIIKGRDVVEIYKKQYKKRLHLALAADYALTAGAWTKMTIDTTILNNLPGASLAASVMAIPAGAYNIKIRTVIANTGNDQIIRLRNTTAGSTLFCTGWTVVQKGFEDFNIIISAPSNLEIQYYSAAAGTIYGGYTYQGETAYTTQIIYDLLSEIE